MTPEKVRLQEEQEKKQFWKKWGPYLTERQWGTVREDYSAHGQAWEFVSHEMARSKAYRWGEDGIAGLCDDEQRLCLALSLWNGRDPILKERMFGLTGNEGNHGEDVKEYYYYLDSTPTHSYMKMLYKYPQGEFPYAALMQENSRRGKEDPEFELIDTGIFDEDRYFDVFVEYAKAGPDDILMRITAHNRGSDAAPLHIAPQIWFRNTWNWREGAARPALKKIAAGEIELEHPELGTFRLYAAGAAELLFCDNETNAPKLYCTGDGQGYFKDGISDYIAQGKKDAVNPQERGSKAAAHYELSVAAGDSATVRLRLRSQGSGQPFGDFEQVFAQRREEADAFYTELQAGIKEEDARGIQRQALASMLWSKQFYYYDVREWLEGDPGQPTPPAGRKRGRNKEWLHLENKDIISMPDTWEYPWYAAWDLAFHCLPLALVDPEFAKRQLILMTRVWYMHPNGQMPAYEWAFSDVNPPVHAWATWRVYQMDRTARGGRGDLDFLERVFHKLLLNFTWWVNRKDTEGRNIFQGGFLGLDNIGVFDRSAPLPTGGFINQADGTSWVAMYSLNLMRIALELAQHNRTYEDIATKFFHHFLHIAEAMTNIADEGIGLWDEEDEFYYDVLNLPDGRKHPLRLRTMVGLIPLFAVETLEPELIDQLPNFKEHMEHFLRENPNLANLISRWQEPGSGARRLLSLLRGHRMKCLLRRMLDESEFLSDYGVRAMSKVYADEPYVFDSGGGNSASVKYQPAESDTDLFGGNSNWRGPIWFPVNFLLIESLQKFHHYYGEDFKVECPTGSGNFMTILDIANELSRRLCKIFLRDESGRRPVFNQYEKFQSDPHFRDYILFYEYFHGDSGRGVGASHQTGWTGLVAKLLQPRRQADGKLNAAEKKPNKEGK